MTDKNWDETYFHAMERETLQLVKIDINHCIMEICCASGKVFRIFLEQGLRARQALERAEKSIELLKSPVVIKSFLNESPPVVFIATACGTIFEYCFSEPPVIKVLFPEPPKVFYVPVKFGSLAGKVITSFFTSHDQKKISIICSDNSGYIMHHERECCEEVWVDDICGDVDDILDTPVMSAVESVNVNDDPSKTWTFYKIDTRAGGITIRWCGESNGHYSETVDFERCM